MFTIHHFEKKNHFLYNQCGSKGQIHTKFEWHKRTYQFHNLRISSMYKNYTLEGP